MDRQSRRFRLAAWLTGASVLAVISAGTPVRAQDTGTAPGDDPPARVGRLARLEGDVSAHGPDTLQWTPAVLNFPFVSGDALWTQPQAQADIEIGASVATLADNTEFDLASLDDQNLVASEPQGAMFLHLRHVRPGETYTINTPRGAVQIAADGEYEILAGDANTPTRVAVVRGAAQLTSGALALRAGQGQLITATGDQQQVGGDVEPLTSYDRFLTTMLARNSVPLDSPQVTQGMTGAEDLGQYGRWEDTPDYGQVWYPQVAPDWVPYRDGSWSYVAPWGWTWVDSEPWGFAPFHYGRWAQVRHRWCWVPGEPGAPVEARPAYAPALVDFIAAGALGGAAAGAIAASLASGRGDIGWVPLGPHEIYAPPYGGSSRYLRRLNWGHGWHRPEWGERPGQARHTTTVDNTHHVFINRGALTMAPVSAFVRSQQIRPVAHSIHSPAAQELQLSAVPLHGPLPLRPIAEMRGATPRAAERFGFPGGSAHPTAPGPTSRPGALHPIAPPGGPFPFRAGQGPIGVHPPVAAGPGPDIRQHTPMVPQPPVHPFAPGLPPLRPGQPVQPGHPNVVIAPRVAPLRTPDLPTHRPATLPYPVPAQPPRRIEAPRLIEPRPVPARPIEPRLAPPPPAFHPGPVRPMMPPVGPPRPMMMPHFEAPRPMALPPAAPHMAPLPGPRPPGPPPHP